MTKTKMPLETALPIAELLRKRIASYCDQIEIAGSVRRCEPQVGDIELVARPRMEQVPDLFGTQHNRSLLDLTWGLSEIGNVVKNGSRFKQIELPEGISLDLWIVLPPAQWGVIYLLRTGPADFSKWMVTQRSKGGALPSNVVLRDGAPYRGGELIEIATELDYFRLCGLSWMPPDRREPLWRQ